MTQKTMKKLVVVIPAYNEEGAIGQVIKSLPLKINGMKVIPVVVDDGSTDRTGKVAKSAGALTLRHRLNLGTGAATLTGFAAAKRLDAHTAVTIDGDGQHDPDDIKKVLQPILQDKADLVIGSRLKNPSQMPKIKVFVNKLANVVTYLLGGVRSSDSQSGFRGLSHKALKRLQLDSTGYEICSEMIMQTKSCHLKYCEVPIKVIYTPYSKAKGQHPFNGINVIIKLLSRWVRS